MKNKKGYTVVELLATLLIIGILLLIGIPTIRKYINRGTSAYYTAIEKEMKVAGSEYLNTYRTLLPRVIGHSTVISLDEVVANNYIDPVVDEDGNSCTGQIMAVKRKKDGYDYHACLRCGNRYVSKDDNCKVSDTSDTGFENNELDNTYEDSANYRIVFDQYEYEVEQTQEFVLPTGRVEHLENGEWKEINVEPVVSTKKVDTNSLGTKTVIYSYHGSKTEIKVNIVDKVAPSKPEIVVKYESANGNNYQGNWYSGRLYVEYKSTDYTKKNVLGSGIKNYEYSLDGDNWIEVRKDNDSNKEFTDWNIIDANATSNKIIPSDGEYTIKVRARDKNENVSEVNVYTIKIDTKAPDCKLKVAGDVGYENWYKSGITVTYDISTDSTSRILTTPITARRADNSVITTGASSVTINTPEENIRVYGTITDEAGNVTVCEAPALDGGYRLKLDPKVPEVPTITATDGNGVGGRWYTGVDSYESTPKSGVWHINDTTLTFSGTSNISKNIYYYRIDNDMSVNSTGRITNATNGEGFDERSVSANAIKTIHSENTTGTTYYVRICSVAGNCSNSSNYVVKLDKVDPVPVITATDGNPLGNLWYINESQTSNTPVSGVWHIENTKLTFSGASNISGNIYKYKAGGAITIDKGRGTSGTANTTEVNITSNTTSSGTNYNVVLCSIAGRCGTADYLLKLDKSVPSAPTIKAHDNKASNTWHNASDVSGNNGNVTLTLSGGSNASGNIYWHRENAEPAVTSGRISAGTKGNITRGSEVNSTTYYAKTCSVAGKCSTSSSYILKFDKTVPGCSDFSGQSTSWTNSNRTISVSCVAGSGSACTGSKSWSYTTGTTKTANVSQSFSDEAGNSVTCSKTVNVYVDKDAPGCSSFSGGGGSWTNQNRTVSVSCDAKGGSPCTGSKSWSYTTGTTSTANLSTSFSDAAGNSVTCTSNNHPIYVDKDAPGCSNFSGESTSWTNQNRTISVSCDAKGGSPCTGSKSWTYSTSTTTANLSTSFSDTAGNSVTCSKTANVYVDKDRPTCTYSLSPDSSANYNNPFYYASNQTLTITCTDTGGSGLPRIHLHVLTANGSEVDEVRPTTTTLALNQEKVYDVYVHVTDNAGNSINKTPMNADGNAYYQRYIIDKTRPGIAYNTPASTANSCYNTNISLQVASYDTYNRNMSMHRYYDRGQGSTFLGELTSTNGNIYTTLSDEGWYGVFTKAWDKAGNLSVPEYSNSGKTEPYQYQTNSDGWVYRNYCIDKTQPTCTINVSGNTASISCADSSSSVWNSGTVSCDISSNGPFSSTTTINGTTTDKAGNTGTCSATYTQPTSDPGTDPNPGGGGGRCDSTWTYYTGWSACSNSCGAGKKYRYGQNKSNSDNSNCGAGWQEDDDCYETYGCGTPATPTPAPTPTPTPDDKCKCVNGVPTCCFGNRCPC